MTSVGFPKKFNISNLKQIKAMSANQQLTMEAFKKGDNLVLSGSAGTGKTFLALYLALEQVLDRDSLYDKVVIVRTAVPTKDMGFMPGTKEEKEALFIQPYMQLMTTLFGLHETERLWNALLAQGLVEFITTSYIRGITIENAIVVIDEYQNMSYHELSSCMTRLGENTKVAFCGDTKQIDLIGWKEKDGEGPKTFVKILSDMMRFTLVEFTQSDSVRSGIVRDFLRCEELHFENIKGE